MEGTISDDYLSSDDDLSRYDAQKMAIDEIMDIPGLSKICTILKKYNLTLACIDYKLNVTAKRMRNYCPKKDNGAKRIK